MFSLTSVFVLVTVHVCLCLYLSVYYLCCTSHLYLYRLLFFYVYDVSKVLVDVREFLSRFKMYLLCTLSISHLTIYNRVMYVRSLRIYSDVLSADTSASVRSITALLTSGTAQLRVSLPYVCKSLQLCKSLPLTREVTLYNAER